MKTFTVYTNGNGDTHVFNSFVPKRDSDGNWEIRIGAKCIPLGKRDVDTLLVQSGEKNPCPARKEKIWDDGHHLHAAVCPKCGQKFGKWEKDTIGFKSVHPNIGEVDRGDLVIKEAFCLKVSDKTTGHFNGKMLLVAPDKEQAEALVYWSLEGHSAIFPEDVRIVAEDTRQSGDSHYLLALRSGGNFRAKSSLDPQADYYIELSFDGNNVQVAEHALSSGHKVPQASAM